MKKISLIIQGDETLSNRQRVVVNPIRFKTVQELKDVLSSELNHADGTPMVLPPSAALSFLDPTSGSYVPLVDTSVLSNNSRIKVLRGTNGPGGTSTSQRTLSSVKLLSSQPSMIGRTSANAISTPAASSGNFFDSEMAESAILELMVYHAQVVRLLSSQLRPDKEITPQDIAASYELQSASARALVNDMWRQKNATTVKAGGPGLFASAMSQAKIITQFSLQQGATERETSEGDAASQLKETVSAFQARVDRLERELAEVTTLYESTQHLLLVANQDKERTLSDMEDKLERYQQENALLRAATREATFRSSYLEKELADTVELQQRAQLDTLLFVDDADDEGAKSAAAKRQAAADAFDQDFLPTTAQEEKYLEITRRSAAAVTGGGGVRLGALARPTTAPAVGKSSHLSPQPLFDRSRAAQSAGKKSAFGGGRSPLLLSGSFSMEDNNSSSSLVSPSKRSTLTIIVRSLPRGSVSARQETLQISDPSITQSLPRFVWYLRERCGLSLSHTATSVEVSYVAGGLRKVIDTEDDLCAFVRQAEEAPPLPGNARGPCPMSLSVIEFNSDERNGIVNETARLDSPGAPGSPDASSPRCGKSSPGPADGPASNEDGIDTSPRTDAQKARLEAARFLGKKINADDLCRPITQQVEGQEDSEDASSRGGTSSPTTDSRRSGAGSKLLNTISRLRRPNGGATTASASASGSDALSTRSLFLHAASVTVPRDDEMRAMFHTLSKGGAAVDRTALAEFLVKRYDDIGEPSKFYRMVGLAPPSSHSTAGRCASAATRNTEPVTVEEFCMIIYKLVRE